MGAAWEPVQVQLCESGIELTRPQKGGVRVLLPTVVWGTKPPRCTLGDFVWKVQMIKRRSSQGLHLNIFLDFKIQSSVSQTRTSRLSGSGSLSLSVAPVAPRGLHGRPWRLCRASAFGKQSSLWRDFQTTERPVPASPLCRVSGPFLPTLSTGAGAAPEARGRSLSVPGWSLPRSPARVHQGQHSGEEAWPGHPRLPPGRRWFFRFWSRECVLAGRGGRKAGGGVSHPLLSGVTWWGVAPPSPVRPRGPSPVRPREQTRPSAILGARHWGIQP